MRGFRIYGAIILAMIFWSLSFIWFKMANENYKPLTIIFLRLLFAVVILSAYLFIKGEKNTIKKEDRKWFLLLAVFEPFLYFIGESNGLTYVTSTTGAVVISTIPAVVALAAWLFFKERLSLINYTGIILSFAGIIVFVVDGSGALSFNIKGLLLLGLAVFSAAGYNMTLGRLVGSYSPVFIVNMQNILGVILFTPIFILTDFNNFFSSSHSFSSLLPVMELALFASCGAFILFGWSVKQIGVARVNPFTNFSPVFTAIFSFLILGNTITFQNTAGMIIVICGIFLSQVNGRKKISGELPDLSGKTA
ncbi:MAG: DMT family transporter [Bacteroidales bacterium]|nr:DMT family transporter [Bacteroidales bacterium]